MALQWAGTAEEIIAICDSTDGRRFLRHPHLGLIFPEAAPFVRGCTRVRSERGACVISDATGTCARCQ